MAESEIAFLYQDIEVFAVTFIGVSPGSFASLKGYCVVVHRHVASPDMNIGAGINIDSVGAWSLYLVVW